MNTQYSCPSDRCRKDDGTPYTIEIPGEAVLDENNIANMFCPRCHSPLTRQVQSEDAPSPA